MNGLEDVVYLHNGIILTHKTEQNNAIFHNMDGTRESHTKWSKQKEKDKNHMILLISGVKYME